MAIELKHTRRARDEDSPELERREKAPGHKPAPEPEEWDVPGIDPRGRVELRPWDDNSKMRGTLALAATTIFGLTITWACWQTGAGHWSLIKDLFQALLPCETGFLGSAVTYYFVNRHR